MPRISEREVQHLYSSTSVNIPTLMRWSGRTKKEVMALVAHLPRFIEETEPLVFKICGVNVVTLTNKRIRLDNGGWKIETIRMGINEALKVTVPTLQVERDWSISGTTDLILTTTWKKGE